MKKAGIFMMTTLLASWAHAFEYRLANTPTDPTFRKNAQVLLRQAEELLPASIKNVFKKPLQVRFESLKTQSEHALGKLSRGAIIIDVKAIPEITRGEQNATLTGRSHKTFYREILATVIHETIHAYDELNVHDAVEARMIQQCKRAQDLRRNNDKTSSECRPYIDMYRSYSQNPYFLLTAGFVDGEESWMKHRSPDVYELTSSFEAFPVNMEYFLMDPAYACRRPSLYSLFRNKFQHTPFPTTPCIAALNYVLPDFKGKESPLKSIDLNRVYEIDYLMAGEGDTMMSGWGHSMFRIVMCAPGRKSLGPDCRKDLSEHIVLSYRAFVNSVQINTLKGLTGEYPSRLFFVPMDQVIDEYNKTELRDLRSIPLRLNRAEIRQFIIRAIETHWSYDGQYYFTSNNCAVESLNLLKTSIFRPGLVSIEIKTPIGLEIDLIRKGLADDSVLKNRLSAISNGHLFDSYRDRYELSYTVLRKELNLKHKDFLEFLQTPAAQRHKIYQKLSALQGHELRRAAAAVVLLENGAHRFLTAKVKAQLSEQIIQEERKAAKAGTKMRQNEIVQTLTEISDMFSQPASFLRGASGYGLPTQQDWEKVERLSAQKRNEGTEIYKEVEKTVESLLMSSQIDEAEAIKENVLFALGYMKSL